MASSPRRHRDLRLAAGYLAPRAWGAHPGAIRRGGVRASAFWVPSFVCLARSVCESQERRRETYRVAGPEEPVEAVLRLGRRLEMCELVRETCESRRCRRLLARRLGLRLSQLVDALDILGREVPPEVTRGVGKGRREAIAVVLGCHFVDVVLLSRLENRVWLKLW